MNKEIFKATKESRIVFHYNKAHNSDPTIPTWVIKHNGQTYYVNHFDSQVGFSTKETPDNDHTKGSLQFRGLLTISEQDNQITAYVTKSQA